MKDTISEMLSAFPPSVIRLLARVGKGKASRRMTHEDIAKASGLSYEKVRDLSAMHSWAKVSIADADAFMRGCGVTLRNLWRHRYFLRRSLDPRKTGTPLAFTSRRGVAQKPPPPEMLVAAALSHHRRSGSRSRASRSASSASAPSPSAASPSEPEA